MLVSSNITGCGLTVKGIQTEWQGGITIAKSGLVSWVRDGLV